MHLADQIHEKQNCLMRTKFSEMKIVRISSPVLHNPQNYTSIIICLSFCHIQLFCGCVLYSTSLKVCLYLSVVKIIFAHALLHFLSCGKNLVKLTFFRNVALFQGFYQLDVGLQLLFLMSEQW